ncbi:ectoine/hydroxyectoine ABC transporter permease subunit EhuC [Paenibacillus aurantius]|uniref:Ectoine/hydroxyectoine ABC transporter permease subunit EhuC n=1 Tax=Paenibacillus aurantius TaxID=2918900 RepID=A0AA96LGX5_9BACL|nr:ectoine/hydroxyectoine ABC transporter permease subunit EhuC [Paenibacillus aurantius]WJH36537.1 ectoine/hydroxyectoine ABC transporter permease subunit EhuC [Paenibacillus sp. CC-CFT747]WNQ11870.1 ectoine/hydroxyectoine ABC transporter permease subunit EhuC [Paenibacillus aurantius]
MPTSWTDFLPAFWDGLEVTLKVTAWGAVLALVVSFVSGLCRLSKLWIVRTVTGVYVEIFRGTSLLIQLFWLYFALPILGLELPKLTAAVLAVGLNFGAYGSEIVRSSILAVPKGQWEAAIALNLTPYQRLVRVIFPQAFVRMLPPFGNQMIELVKSTSLVYFITMADLTYQAMILRNNYISWTWEILTLLLVFYFVISAGIALLVRLLERKMTAGRV